MESLLSNGQRVVATANEIGQEFAIFANEMRLLKGNLSQLSCVTQGLIDLPPLITRLPTTQPVIVVFGSHRSMINDGVKATEFNKKLGYITSICTNWQHFYRDILFNPVLIVVYPDFAVENKIPIMDFVNTVSTVIKCTPECANTPLAVLVNKNINASIIKLLKKSEVSGIVPNYDDYGFVEISTALTNLISHKAHWPEHILSTLAKCKISKPCEDVTNSSIKLTSRQQEIFKLIKQRGISNKTIAKMLNISESAVKLHVGAILKKYNVRNRTQLAVFSKSTEV